MDVAAKQDNTNHKTDKWVRIIQAIVGAAILGLQGVNISETNGQTHLIQRIDRALEQQVQLVKEVNQEGETIDKALKNQEKMIQNQNIALDLLKTEEEKSQKNAPVH